ncbi:MAG: UDP-N-acetylmuramoyl-L-alanine--D-glutamate ligase [Gammaproteobacteria bacterium]|nr:UDP-N-acetylmuramoyl-L-alanine--D-glutamate ligase [Gammaproteobacteria bacterium]
MLSAIRVTYREEMQEIQKKFDAIVIGLGMTGMSFVRHLSEKTTRLGVVDTRHNPPQLDTLLKEYPDIPFIAGKFDQDLLSSADLLLVSPGVTLSSPAIQAAIHSGAAISGDIELFLNEAQAPVIAVTGSNGKSTVAKLVSEMIAGSGRKVLLGGNYGVPALALLESDVPDFYVLELSSFQLETLNNVNIAVSTILNISEDHMDRYRNFQEYVSVKGKIFKGEGIKIINLDDPVVCNLVRTDDNVISFTHEKPEEGSFGVCQVGDIEWICFGNQRILKVSELQITGRHNLTNSLASLALGNAIGLEIESMAESLKQFKGLPHRCETVLKLNNVEWINDSKATNPGATCAAVQGLANGENIILIAGGDAKNADLSSLSDMVKDRVHSAILIGKDADIVERAISSQCNIYHAMSLAAAVNTAHRIASSGDIVLLSPACSSLDMFADYMERGDKFTICVRQLSDNTGPDK